MSLGELPSLKYLDIRQMENVERIGREFCTLDPRVKAFHSLNVVTLPASTTLQELLISKCANLSELPALPSLQSLKLLNCSSLATVSQFPSLTVLHVCDPFKEEILQRLFSS
uniref:Uncharacterized protein n=1 Tax=Oryza rufipogon TaxID=4529 RepID=A0A0E0R8L4_ORYRU